MEESEVEEVEVVEVEGMEEFRLPFKAWRAFWLSEDGRADLGGGLGALGS